MARSWSFQTLTMPERHNVSCVVIKDSVFIYGGILPMTSTYVSTLAVYDIPSQKLTYPNMGGTTPALRAGHSSVLYNNYLIVFGGAGLNPDNNVHFLNTDTLAWNAAFTSNGSTTGSILGEQNNTILWVQILVPVGIICLAILGIAYHLTLRCKRKIKNNEKKRTSNLVNGFMLEKAKDSHEEMQGWLSDSGPFNQEESWMVERPAETPDIVGWQLDPPPPMAPIERDYSSEKRKSTSIDMRLLKTRSTQLLTRSQLEVPLYPKIMIESFSLQGMKIIFRLIYSWFRAF